MLHPSFVLACVCSLAWRNGLAAQQLLSDTKSTHPNRLLWPQLQQPQPLGLQSLGICKLCSQQGWRPQSWCVSWPRHNVGALLWASTVTKARLAVSACCCFGNLKPLISNAVRSWLSILLHQGVVFVNLEKAKNVQTDFFFFFFCKAFF